MNLIRNAASHGGRHCRWCLLRFLSSNVMMVLFLNAAVGYRASGMQSFAPLTCNNNLNSVSCATTTLSSIVNAASPFDEIVVPCGECVYVDYTDGSTITLANGLNIQGKLYFPTTSNLEIYTSHVYVMGVLQMEAPAGSNKVKFRFFGSTDKYIHPIDNNADKCDASTGCKMGKKPFAVVGGQIDIRGLADPTCPSWVRLEDLKPDLTDNTKLNRVVVGNHAASCWNIGDTIFLTSPDYMIDNSFTTTVLAIDETLGELTTEEVPKVFSLATTKVSPVFAVEVATLNRSIIFDADNDDNQNGGGLMGGHIIIYHTPTVVQIMEGVEINNFGQQGNLGRYPIHFHMCLDVSGSMISKNVVHHSNQRGFVVHGSHNVQIVDNVAFEVFGHCFFTEDGIETGNTFQHNLGANIKESTHLIDPGNDNKPAVFWITNPENHWIENVAAGSENSGFWFDCRFAVRGASANLPGANLINPNSLSVGTYRDNVAHSCDFSGMRYYSPPWQPVKENQLIQGSKVYRNKSNGHFIHSNTNLYFIGGITADNGNAYWTFVNNRIRFEDIKIIGYSEEYRNILKETNSGFTCKYGFQFHPERHMSFKYSGTAMRANNLEFSDYKFCYYPPLMMGYTEVYNLEYHSLEQISNITFLDKGTAKEPISACTARHYGLSNIAIHDLDGSLDPNKNGMPGFLVSNVTKITRFADGAGCTPIPDSCLQFCQETCLRNVKVRVSSSFSLRNIEMVIIDGEGNEDAAAWDRWEFGEFFNFGSVYDIYQNSDIEREGMYLLALPTGSYYLSFRDRSSQQTVWVDWAYIVYENSPENCVGYVTEDSITLQVPAFDEVRCSSELLDDGDLENIVDIPGNIMGGWLQDNMNLELVDSGAGGSGYSLRAKGKAGKSYLAQYIDKSCIVGFVLLEFSADIRLENSDGSSTWCQVNECLAVKIDSFDGNSLRSRFAKVIASISSSSEVVDGWYKVQGSLEINEFDDFSDRVLLRIDQPSDGKNFVIDNVSLRLTKQTPPTSTPTSPRAPTSSPHPTPQPTNLALNKPATQSSTANGWDASLAVDGNINSFTHTDSMKDNEWKLDLEVKASINSIKIYNRKCNYNCMSRLNGASIFVLNHNEDIVHFEKVTEDGPAIVEFMFESKECRYVHIHLYGNFLSLAEVEVYGYVLSDLSPTQEPSNIITLSPQPTPLVTKVTPSPTVEETRTPPPTNFPTSNPSTSTPIKSPSFVPTNIPTSCPNKMEKMIIEVNGDKNVKKDKAVWALYVQNGNKWKKVKEMSGSLRNFVNKKGELASQCMKTSKCYRIVLKEKPKNKKKNKGMKGGYIKVNFDGNTSIGNDWTKKKKYTLSGVGECD